ARIASTSRTLACSPAGNRSSPGSTEARIADPRAPRPAATSLRTTDRREPPQQAPTGSEESSSEDSTPPRAPAAASRPRHRIRAASRETADTRCSTARSLSLAPSAREIAHRREPSRSTATPRLLTPSQRSPESRNTYEIQLFFLPV